MGFEFVDIVLYIVYLVSTLSLVAIVWSNVRHLRKGGRSEKIVNRVPVRKITLGVFAFLVVILLVSFLFSSASPVKVGGELFKDVLWLRLADVCVFTLVAMLAACLLSVLFSIVKDRLK